MKISELNTLLAHGPVIISGLLCKDWLGASSEYFELKDVTAMYPTETGPHGTPTRKTVAMYHGRAPGEIRLEGGNLGEAPTCFSKWRVVDQPWATVVDACQVGVASVQRKGFA